MCLCAKRPCCRCIWKRCTFCAEHLLCLRISLILLCLTDIAIMCWYLYAIEHSRDDLTTACGVTNTYNHTTITTNNLSTVYDTCTDLDSHSFGLSTFWDVLTPFPIVTHYQPADYNWIWFRSLFSSKYSSLNLTISSDGGYVYNDQHTDCLSDTVFQCLNHVSYVTLCPHGKANGITETQWIQSVAL